VNKYHELEDRYYETTERGDRYDKVMAEGEMRRCAQKICMDNGAMSYLQKNDKDLFKEMSVMREQEKVRGLEKGFEMEL
jgi:hypothetical protein